jgi:branched-chain amino acid transport system substrate-binding protein
MAIATLAEQRRFPFVIDIAAADVITQKGYKYTFRVFPRGSVFGVKACNYIVQILNEKKLSPKRGVVINEGDLFGKAQSESFVNAHSALKDKLRIPFEIVDHIVYPMGAQDLSAEIARVKAAKPDILFPIARPGDARLTIRELYKQRVELLGIISPGSPGWYEPEFIADMGKLAEYVMDNVPWYDPTSLTYKRIGKKYSGLYPGKYIDTNNGYAYLATMVLADAIERAGSTETDAIVAALRKTNYKESPMVGGPVIFDENGDNINASSAMVQVLEGKVKVVLPKEASEADYVFPVPQLWERGV